MEARYVEEATADYRANRQVFREIVEVARANPILKRIEKGGSFDPSQAGSTNYVPWASPQQSREAYDKILVLMKRLNVDVVERGSRGEILHPGSNEGLFVSFGTYAHVCGYHTGPEVVTIEYSEEPVIAAIKDGEGRLACPALGDRNWYVCRCYDAPENPKK